MNVETRSQFKNRKRDRQPLFDLNRTIPHELPKVRRTDNQMRRMSNPPEPNRPQFIDMSQTINTNTQPVNMNPSSSSGAGNNVVEENITPEVRDMVADEAMVVQRSLEDKVRKMVHDEMAEVRKSIADLTKCVADLSRMTVQNQSANFSNQTVSNTAGSNSSQTGAH
ncbi:hypothetical protein CVS40_0582 [Lucilia cuprina]|nr:hypothetical protein CVS40_0582 [Lucilia cuprina]KAI8130349.1 hypothetical protein CVS40_0582 [Lucilia cuprina]